MQRYRQIGIEEKRRDDEIKICYFSLLRKKSLKLNHSRYHEFFLFSHEENSRKKKGSID